MSEPLARAVKTEQGSYYEIPALHRAGLVHGFSCRDLQASGSQPEEILAGALGIEGLTPARLRQRHTSLVHQVGPATRPLDPPPEGDALFSVEPGWSLMVQTADCLPLLLVDTDSRSYAAVHAGWRGTLAGVLAATLKRWGAHGSVDPSRIWMAIGPAIRQCCFEVGDEVVEEFHATWKSAVDWFRPGRHRNMHLDLAAANRHQALAAGLTPGRILDTDLCTVCRQDLFYSYRAEKGTSGRIVTLAAIHP